MSRTDACAWSRKTCSGLSFRNAQPPCALFPVGAGMSPRQVKETPCSYPFGGQGMRRLCERRICIGKPEGECRCFFARPAKCSGCRLRMLSFLFRLRLEIIANGCDCSKKSARSVSLITGPELRRLTHYLDLVRFFHVTIHAEYGSLGIIFFVIPAWRHH